MPRVKVLLVRHSRALYNRAPSRNASIMRCSCQKIQSVGPFVRREQAPRRVAKATKGRLASFAAPIQFSSCHTHTLSLSPFAEIGAGTLIPHSALSDRVRRWAVDINVIRAQKRGYCKDDRQANPHCVANSNLNPNCGARIRVNRMERDPQRLVQSIDKIA